MRTPDSDKTIFNRKWGKKSHLYICGNNLQQYKKDDRMVQGVGLFCNLIILPLLTLQTEIILNLYQELMAENYYYPLWRHF